MKSPLLVFLTSLSTLSLLLAPAVPQAWAHPSLEASRSPASAEGEGDRTPAGSGPLSPAQDSAVPPNTDWYMAGANPQRTGWVSQGVSGVLRPIWYRPFAPFINGKVQVVATNNTLFVSTANGLYAINPSDGAIRWTYPTELPLGHSPTVVNNVVYVGGMDRRIHALDASTGQVKSGWNSYVAGAGYEVNPLVVNGMVYAGNRDGYFYALDANSGSLKWRFQTGGPIRFSAAASPDNATIYFASMDGRAYALGAATGNLIWKSAKFPGAGFMSYWPVVYGDYVVFAGSVHYVFDNGLAVSNGGIQQYKDIEWSEAFSGLSEGDVIGAMGRVAGNWVGGTLTIDASRMASYLEAHPERRHVFVLSRADGSEYTMDLDSDGKKEYAPYVWIGTHSGNRFPPVVGPDNVLYQENYLVYRAWIGSGQATGWKMGTPYVSSVMPRSGLYQTDEPFAYSIGGSILYFNCWFSSVGGAVDLSKPVSDFSVPDGSREWFYYNEGGNDLGNKIPGYHIRKTNDVYGHTTLNPPIPYAGKVYTLNNGALVAWGNTTAAAIQLPTVEPTQVQDNVPAFSTSELEERLKLEIQKMVDAGHLRPGYHGQGLGDLGSNVPSDTSHLPYYMSHYFHNPAETIYTLLQALPYMTDTLDDPYPTDPSKTWRQKLREYIQSEYAQYNPGVYGHMGWNAGAAREIYDTLPEVTTVMANSRSGSAGTLYWSFPPINFYALWKYAQEFGGASTIFNTYRSKLPSPPDDAFLVQYPYILNAYLGGYYGYCQLEKLANGGTSCSQQSTLTRLLNLKVNNFTIDHPTWTDGGVSGTYNNISNVFRNFLNLVPEIVDELIRVDGQFPSEVEAAINVYSDTAPYWFVSKYDATIGEGTLDMLYNVPALFQAKARILKQSREELSKYLDAPAFERGDLFYIQNLVAAIEAEGGGPEPTFSDVPFTHPYHDVIEVLYQAGYTAGCSTNPLMYCPEATMNRAESSVFVERGIHTATYDPPAPTSQVFADTPLDSWAAKWVTGLWNDQYTAGCGTNPLVYCPWQGHTRAEGCVFYLRMMRGATYDPPQPAQPTFVDVPLEAWYAKWVQAAVEAGLITACQTTPDLRFCPDGPLTRALAAYMMVQAKGLRLP